MKNQLTLGVVATLFIVGATACKDPNAEKTKAQVSEAKAVSSESAAAVKNAEALTFDQSNSKVEFVGSKVTGKHEGSFEKFSGNVKLVADKVETSQLSVDVDTTSVKTDQEKLTGHLKSPDFFDVAKYPSAKFVTTEIKTGGEKGATHTVTGNLNLHGVEKSISFPATVSVTADAFSASAEFTINRKDFGIVYAGKADDLINDLVALKLTIKAPRKK
jgi:polyisoprenoid-binding protein YceI